MNIKKTERKAMSNTKPKRDPLSNAPTSEEIMSVARRRKAGQRNSIPVRHRTSIPVNQPDITLSKPKATFYLPRDLLRTLKRYAFEKAESQSKVVENAVHDYMTRNPLAAE